MSEMQLLIITTSLQPKASNGTKVNLQVNKHPTLHYFISSPLINYWGLLKGLRATSLTSKTLTENIKLLSTSMEFKI